MHTIKQTKALVESVRQAMIGDRPMIVLASQGPEPDAVLEVLHKNAAEHLAALTRIRNNFKALPEALNDDLKKRWVDQDGQRVAYVRLSDVLGFLRGYKL